MHVLIKGSSVAAYPYSIFQLYKDNPNTSFPDSITDQELAEWSVYPVGYVAPPDFSLATHDCVPADPVRANGAWQQSWKLVPISDPIKAQRTLDKSVEVRSERNARLTASDWTQLTDVAGTVDQNSWTAYRTALRNVTSQTGFPWQVQWPIEPSAS